ncbi:type II toxin-antitoxin system HicB family antitoxin [Cupriavidus plantarum]|uniref:Antitoxin HicB n=1 Tax=Cupriavidus plantarum TaxID=942865 RepID=A0A316EXX0_9BURK|nr:type II toxin-antitoxin system HicB family antitoxin [Cupriavidus plantarum]PWK36695.1 antitoxin HicB [Cupriavidus plantarum]
MFAYPVTLTPDDNGTLLVTFKDVPEAITVGESEDDALTQALDALEAAFEVYFAEKRPIPMPSKPRRGQRFVQLPVLTATKVLLANEMLAQKVRKSDLARRMGINQVQVDRMLKMNHATRVESLETALGLLGRHLEVSLV